MFIKYQKIYDSGKTYSACFLDINNIINNQYYIAVSNWKDEDKS